MKPNHDRSVYNAVAAWAVDFGRRWQCIAPVEDLVDARDDTAADKLAVLVPVLSILLLASLVVAKLTVHEQNRKVGNVEVRNGGSESTRQRPCPGHDPVAKIVGVSRTAPPARSQQLASRSGGHVLEVLGVGAVAELVLFRVGFAENVVADEVDSNDSRSSSDTEVDRSESKVAGLQTVDEGHPDEVSNREHETEAVGGNVHSGEDGRLHEERIGNVPEVEGANENHAVRHTAVQLNILMAGAANVEDGPQDETGSELVERFDVEAADAGVEFTADEPVVEDVARVSAESEQLAFAKRAEVAVHSLGERVEERGRDKTRPVLVEDGEALWTLVKDPTDRGSHGNKERGKSIELVVQTLAGSKLGAFKVLSGQHDPCQDGECVPCSIDGPPGGVKQAVLDALDEQGSQRIGAVDRKGERTSELFRASKVEVVRKEGHGERDKGSAKRTRKLVVCGLGTELLLGEGLLAHGGRFASTDGG